MEPQPNKERIHETWRKSLTWRLVSATLGFSLARQRRFSQLQPGATPQAGGYVRPSALKARFTYVRFSVIIRVMPQSLSKVILHIIL